MRQLRDSKIETWNIWSEIPHVVSVLGRWVVYLGEKIPLPGTAWSSLGGFHQRVLVEGSCLRLFPAFSTMVQVWANATQQSQLFRKQILDGCLGWSRSKMGKVCYSSRSGQYSWKLWPQRWPGLDTFWTHSGEHDKRAFGLRLDLNQQGALFPQRENPSVLIGCTEFTRLRFSVWRELRGINKGKTQSSTNF